MLRGLYTSASGMMVQRERQNVISNNLANSNTTGFKKDQTIIRQFPSFELYRKDDESVITPFENTNKLTKIGKMGTGSQVKDIKIIHKQGNLRKTGNNLDFGIQGEGYFVVNTEHGIKLSRDGAATVDQNGVLVTKNGDQILGINENGQLGIIRTDNLNFRLGKQGELVNAEFEEGNFSNISIVGGFQGDPRLFIANLNDKMDLKKEGANYYNLDDVNTIDIDTTSRVHQNMIEESTVNTVSEMVEMINCARSYETNQKVLTAQDDLLEKAVNQVGKWS